MTIYEHKVTIQAASGSVSTTTLRILGGLCRQVYVKAGTSTTVFRMNITDEDGDNIVDYGFSTGMLNDCSIAIPMSGTHMINITNASPDDTFKVKLKLEE